MPEAPEAPAPATGTEETAPETPATGTEEIAEAPKPDALQAEVERWKAQARKNEDRAKANASAAKELEELRRQSMTDQEKAVAEARAEGRKEVTSKLFSAEVRALAATSLADPSILKNPSTALDLLGLDEIPLNAEGDIDSEAIAAAIAKLAEAKPYLSADAKPASKFNGSADGGPRGSDSPTLEQQIAEAQAKGDANAVIRLNGQRLAEMSRL